MYYISENIKDLQDYNNFVNKKENYSGTTTNWSDIIKHKDENLFAILINDKYITNLQSIVEPIGWYNKKEEL
jgi:hypothetical protein